jgi:hypothetical protein
LLAQAWRDRYLAASAFNLRDLVGRTTNWSNEHARRYRRKARFNQR